MLLSKYSTNCYIINEISVPNINSPHPKEEVVNSSMALPFTYYRRQSFTKLNKLSLSVSPQPHFPWKYKKNSPGRHNPRDWLSIVLNCTMASLKKLLPISNFRRRLGQTHSFPKQSDSAIRRNMDPVAHVTQPQNREVNKFPLCSIVAYIVHYFYT